MCDIKSVLKQEMREELISNILPFWMNKMKDDENGGYYGRLRGDNVLIKDADKVAVMNARALWAFSSAYIVFKDEQYLLEARRAKDYILKHFIDKEYGGVYWTLDYLGNPKNTKKQVYAIAFMISALSAYYQASKDEESLKTAKSLYYDLEKYSYDPKYKGYIEAMSRDWGHIDDMRLSPRDENEVKTMNTHIHILEAYTQLYKIWPDENLKKQLRSIIQIFFGKILNKVTMHLNLYFDEKWNAKSPSISYGHDIGASWLLQEATKAIGDQTLYNTMKFLLHSLKESASLGLEYNEDKTECSMIYERNRNQKRVDREKHWWVQADSVVGYYYYYLNSGDEESLEIAYKGWTFIKNHIIDKKNGGWHWGTLEDGNVNLKDDKAGFWKSCYHSTRMCLSIITDLKD